MHKCSACARCSVKFWEKMQPLPAWNFKSRGRGNQNITQAEEVCVSYESYGWWVTVLMRAYSGGFCLIKESGKDPLACWRLSRRYPHGEEEHALCGQDNMGTNKEPLVDEGMANLKNQKKVALGRWHRAKNRMARWVVEGFSGSLLWSLYEALS